MKRLARLCAAALFFGSSLASCSGAQSRSSLLPGDRISRGGQEIVVCGQFFHVGAPVILWTDPGGYDAYRTHQHFDPEQGGPSRNPDRVSRFDSWRGGLPDDLAARVRQQGWTLEDLRQVVQQVVVHYDVCGSSEKCFKVLHDIRGLSCHFLLDRDGTIYQTLDLKERAWHAGSANDASVGIEIAHMGAYPARVKSQEFLDQPGSPPARPGIMEGEIHGRKYYQHDFTEAQYQSLEKLLVALTRALPGIDRRIPTNPAGKAVTSMLPDGGRGFRGVLGHYHLTRGKTDPGPAFDWARIERALQGR